MTESLLMICIVAFLTVMGILSILAFAIHLLTFYFPETMKKSDTPLIAAINTVVAATFSGARVTEIKEIASLER